MRIMEFMQFHLHERQGSERVHCQIRLSTVLIPADFYEPALHIDVVHSTKYLHRAAGLAHQVDVENWPSHGRRWRQHTAIGLVKVIETQNSRSGGIPK